MSERVVDPEGLGKVGKSSIAFVRKTIDWFHSLPEGKLLFGKIVWEREFLFSERDEISVDRKGGEFGDIGSREEQLVEGVGKLLHFRKLMRRRSRSRDREGFKAPRSYRHGGYSERR